MRPAVRRDAPGATFGPGGSSTRAGACSDGVVGETSVWFTAYTSLQTRWPSRRPFPNGGARPLCRDLVRHLHVGVQALGVNVGLMDLALRAVVAEEPVIAQGLRVPLPRQPHHLRRLPLEPLKLALAHLQTCRNRIHASDPFLSRLTAVESR